VEHFLGRAYYRQGARRRRGWRNGYQPRKVNTAEVQLEIALPQLRATEESFRSRLAPQFREGGDILGRLVTEMYVGGALYRDVEGMFMEALGERVLSRKLWRPLHQAFYTDAGSAPRQSLIHPGGEIPSPPRLSQPAGIESCVVGGNDYHEA